MLRATSVIRKPAVKADRVVDTVTLDHEDRNRRRVALKGDGGLDFLLDLDKATEVNDGDAVKLEDGRLVAIKAAPESLLEITAENALRLMTIAWHIGNRHTPAEITAEAIYIANDHVLAEMVRGQGCAARLVMRAFRPQKGAYHDHSTCDHPDHDHGHHGHEHHHGHAHENHAHENHAHGKHAQEKHDHENHDHAHGAGCGCGHDHHHGHDHKHGHDHAHAHDYAHDHAQDHKHDHKHDHDHKHGHKHDH